VLGRLNVESGIASAEQWSALSTLGSVGGPSNGVIDESQTDYTLMMVQRCVLVRVQVVNAPVTKTSQ
jgi:hypothetical protein